MSSEQKKSEEKFVFEKFAAYLNQCSGYRNYFQGVRDIRHTDSPDFEIELKTSPTAIVGVELTRYLQDPGLIQKKKDKQVIESLMLKANVQRLKSGLTPNISCWFGIGDELRTIIDEKSDCYTKSYQAKSFQQYWLVIHSGNDYDHEFVGDAGPEDVFIYKCNKAMKGLQHPFDKIFLYCYESGNNWACELSEDSKLIRPALLFEGKTVEEIIQECSQIQQSKSCPIPTTLRLVLSCRPYHQALAKSPLQSLLTLKNLCIEMALQSPHN